MLRVSGRDALRVFPGMLPTGASPNVPGGYANVPPRYPMNMPRRPVRPMDNAMAYAYPPMGYPMPVDEMRARPPPEAHDGRPPVAPGGPTPTVYLATYSSVPVYEITVRGIALMRRRSDGYLNATQILKIAGVEKARRTRILEREILTGEHDKVQGGYGTFQGTWIPLQRAQELAITYSVYHLIRPLLDFDPAATKAPAAPYAKKKSVATPTEVPQPARQPPQQQPRFLTLRPPAENAPMLAGGLVHAPEPPSEGSAPGVPPGSLPGAKQALGAYASHGYTPHGILLPPADVAHGTKRPAEDAADAARQVRHEPEPVRDLNALSETPLRAAAPPSDDADAPRFADKAHHPNLGDERERRSREVLTGLFVEEHPQDGDVAPEAQLRALLEELGVESRTKVSPLDLVIDDHGHTALHWASALCRLRLVRMLTALPPSQGGANLFLGNYAGETALHRSVLVTNAYELSQFAELLDLLHDSLQTRDARKRTVLHHIALVAGLKGRAAPAKYYLGCVLSRMQADGHQHGLIDAQDDEGETALSIAARLGNTNMIKMLLDAGARKDLPNYLGITPLDWGITGLPDSPRNQHVAHELGSLRPADVVKSLTRPPPGPVQKSDDVREKLTHTLDELQALFQRETTSKIGAIDTTQGHLQAATRELAARRRHIAAAQDAVTQREEARQMAQNLEQVLRALPSVPDAPPYTAPLDEAHGALQHGDERQYAAQIVRLRWLLQHTNAQCAALERDLRASKARADERRAKYHQVVAVCAHVPADKVDGMLDELLSAVESIGSDADLASVSSFMQKVGRTAPPGLAGPAPSGALHSAEPWAAS